MSHEKKGHGKKHHGKRGGYPGRGKRHHSGKEWKMELEGKEESAALEAGEDLAAIEAGEDRAALEAGEDVSLLEAGEPLSELEAAEVADSIEGAGPPTPRGDALRELHHLTRQSHRLRRKGRGRRGRDSHSGQGRVLKALGLSPKMTQRDLTYILGVSRQGMAETLGKLEESGLVTRSRAIEDRRVTVVELTDEGRSQAEAMFEQEDVLASLLEAFTDEEVETLTGYLERLNAGLSDHLDDDEHGPHGHYGHHGHPGPGEGRGREDRGEGEGRGRREGRRGRRDREDFGPEGRERRRRRDGEGCDGEGRGRGKRGGGDY